MILFYPIFCVILISLTKTAKTYLKIMKTHKAYYFGPYSFTFFEDSILEFWTYNIWNCKDYNSKYMSKNCGFTIIPFRDFFHRFYFSNKVNSYNNKRLMFGIGFFEFFIDYYYKTEGK